MSVACQGWEQPRELPYQQAYHNNKQWGGDGSRSWSHHDAVIDKFSALSMWMDQNLAKEQQEKDSSSSRGDCSEPATPSSASPFFRATATSPLAVPSPSPFQIPSPRLDRSTSSASTPDTPVAVKACFNVHPLSEQEVNSLLPPLSPGCKRGFWPKDRATVGGRVPGSHLRSQEDVQESGTSTSQVTGSLSLDTSSSEASREAKGSSGEGDMEAESSPPANRGGFGLGAGRGLQSGSARLGGLYRSSSTRRGLSQHYSGKSRSFSCLSDAIAVPIAELGKPENPYSKRRKKTHGSHASLLGCQHSLANYYQQSPTGISKKTSLRGFSKQGALAVALAVTETARGDGGVGDNQAGLMRLGWGVGGASPARSFSMVDLQRTREGVPESQ